MSSAPAPRASDETPVRPLEDLVALIDERLTALRRPVESVTYLQYCVRVQVRGPAGVQAFDIYYNAKGMVTNIRPVGGTLDEGERAVVMRAAESAVEAWREARLIENLRSDWRPKVAMVLGHAAELLNDVHFVGAGPYEVRIATEAGSITLFHDGRGRWSRAVPTGPSVGSFDTERACELLLDKLKAVQEAGKKHG